jgi:PAS domain S-box-containing protein
VLLTTPALRWMYQPESRLPVTGSEPLGAEHPLSRRAFLIGPAIEPRRTGLRYASAVAAVLAAGLMRLALTPLLGTQAPLLPFVPAIYAAAYLGGRNPALLACLLSPLLATALFTDWLIDRHTGTWNAHVALFLVIGVLVTLVMDQLQRAYSAQNRALVVAREAERQAHASERQLRLIADALPLLIAYVDREQRIRFHNRGYIEWFGPDAGAVLDRHLSEILSEPDYRERQPHLQAAFRGELVRFPGYHTHIALGLRECEITYVPDRQPNGEIRGFFVMGQDITERVRTEQARELALAGEQWARKEAERLGLVKDEFLATLSHELRTPLHAILSWASLLQSESRSEQHLQRGLEVIERNARLQARIVDDLLDMSRILSGKMRLEVRPLDLQAILAAAIDAVYPAARLKDVQLLSSLAIPVSPVQGDPDRLQQIFWNLLSNAVKFTPSGGRVHVALNQTDSHVEISIEDTGDGIAPEFLSHVFDRFSQADGSITRRSGGLGLGLAIVRSLVELHGGLVSAKSPGKDQGSKFVVTLPLSTAL